VKRNNTLYRGVKKSSILHREVKKNSIQHREVKKNSKQGHLIRISNTQKKGVNHRKKTNNTGKSRLLVT
jgi:hypothetical protein